VDGAGAEINIMTSRKGRRRQNSMNETTNTQVASPAEHFSDDILKGVSDRKRIVGVGAQAVLYALCSVTKNLKIIASEIALILSAQPGIQFNVADSDIEKALVTLVKLRIMQVQRLNIGHLENPRYIKVPDFFRPFLAALSMYEAPLKALTIFPTWDDGVDLDTGEGVRVKSDLVSKEEYDSARGVVMALSHYGVKCTDGLPRITSTTDDSIYRIHQDETGNMLIAGPDVDDVTLLVRSVIRVQLLRKIYGEPRTRYISVDELRGAAEAIAALVA
jgi:hypothetical protein